MGWDSASNLTKKSDVVRDTVSSLIRNGYRILGQASTSQGFYAAIEKSDGSRFLFCAMIKREGGEMYRKDMSETMGPAMTDCPVKLFDLVPMPLEGQGAEWAKQFRDGCKAFHARRKMDLMGKTISLGTGHTYKIDGKQGTCYLMTRDDGQRFRLTRLQAGRCEIIG
jgi:hypothetical protein